MQIGLQDGLTHTTESILTQALQENSVYTDNKLKQIIDQYHLQITDSINKDVQKVILPMASMMLVVAIGIVVSVYVLFSLLIRRRLQALARRFNDVISGDGDLSRRIEVHGNDGIDKLASLFNQLLEKLHITISQAIQTSNQLAAASSKVSVITQSTSQGIMQQQQEIEQTATAMNEMTATVQEVSDHAATAADAAISAESESSKGKQVVEKTIDSINTVADEVSNANNVIQKLQSDSEQIGTVLDVIRSIAEQTNLLALNAAIEAARAGEQGRGFAVVADEVRTLASRTQKSTQEIQEMIERLQHGTNEAAEVMSRGQLRTQESVNQASKAGAALDNITQAVISITEMNRHIASAAKQQSEVAEEMDHSLVKISHVANATAEQAQNMSTEGQQLDRLALHLQELMKKFRV
ncbi:MAG: methyl-accepting chemotaxis protein [Gammaproteobacteria bacterium]|nr:methyl-accepting chemotaxis protein [Gammaproteobacteria bacterium]